MLGIESLMTEEKLCRFCLQNKQTVKNPLISPCNCKGSLEFVHLKCLNRWRRIDVQRNGRLCLICLTNYAFLPPFIQETIPQNNSIFLYYLNYPGLVLITYNYIYAVALSSNKSLTDQLFLQYFYMFSQYIFHLLYFFLLFTEWNVMNKHLYWRQLKTFETALIIAFHLFLILLLQNDLFIVAPFVSFYMGLYWRIHIRLLENINIQLHHLEQE
jgi:hypothetical protein